MDLFNKQKLSALQDRLTLATANAEATAKELADLRESIQKSYDELTASVIRNATILLPRSISVAIKTRKKLIDNNLIV